MRVLLDLNVILDVLLDRAPHAEPAIALWAAIEAGQAEGRLSAHAVTAAAAEADDCAAIVSRDKNGFRNAPLPVQTPAAALSAIRVKRAHS